MDVLRSPIFYMGNKFKLLKQLLPLFPDNCNLFLDCFGGSGVVSANYTAKVTVYNEINENIVNLIKMIMDTDLDELNSYYIRKIEKYNLRTKSNKEDPRANEEGYYKLRDAYNSSEERDYRDLFLLMCYSINHLLRFNAKGEFNASNGADSYNEKNYKQLSDFKERFKNVKVQNKDVFELDFSNLTPEDFVYFDPPYLNTQAVYNEKRAFGGWNIDHDYKLFKIMEDLNEKGIRWGFSNVFANRGTENTHLIDWCKSNKWHVHHLNRNYNPFSRGNSNNDEVYVTNFKKDSL